MFGNWNLGLFWSLVLGSWSFRKVVILIRLTKISRRYQMGAETIHALREVSLEIRRGEYVAIMGPSGSGKSTLAALLLRLRAPSSGRIALDGTDVWDFSPASWHDAVFIVEQDAFLFHGTLRENVLYACTDSRGDALSAAIATANLEDVVANLPQGLDTLVGDRGAMLSGGQRQRVAIARAVVRNPAILILDEATSHLDSVSEQLVQQALNKAARGRTTLVIAHRLSTIREADWIVVLEDGHVVEQGTWDDLKAQAGMFDRLLSGVAAR